MRYFLGKSGSPRYRHRLRVRAPTSQGDTVTSGVNQPSAIPSSLLRLFATLSALGLSIGAYGGQSSTKQPADDEELQEVVVTGTLIRGAAPTGSNVISISSSDVSATGASTTGQLLATVPQISNLFNSLPQISPIGSGGGATGANLQVIRPNLRNTPSPATSTGASTLVLVDGHRMVGVGIQQSAPDPEAVPPGAIERVEIVTDGGSSTYGSDAIGGVINFITRRSFDGIKADVRQGWADNYKTFDTNLTAGTRLGGGSVYISFNYAKHDDIFGRDRSYARQIDWSTGRLDWAPAHRAMCPTFRPTTSTMLCPA
jgi:iron complex outermembrane recepter protein